jgi:YidC/Oxa1 family membrane protein insertase
MDSQKRLMLALVLSLAMTAGYMMLFAPKTTPATETTTPPAAKVEPPPAPAATAPSAPSEVGAPAAAAAPEIEKVRVERKRPNIVYAFSNEGASLVSAELQGKKMREQPTIGIREAYQRLLGKQTEVPPQMNMAVPVDGEPAALSVSIVPKGAQGELISPRTRYQLEEGADGKTLTFTSRQGNVEVVKTFTMLERDFELAMDVTVKNVGTEPLNGELLVHFARAVDPAREHKGSFWTGVIGTESHASCLVGDDLRKVTPDTKPEPDLNGPVRFVGIDQQYFLGVFFPLDAAAGRCTLKALPTGRVTTGAFPLQLAAGASHSQKFGVYVGPKDVELLQTVPSTELGKTGGANIQPPQLERTVDFGIWAVICKVLLVILKALHKVVQNWGVAIILLTVLVKIVLMPLTHKQMVSAEAMKKLQPKMEELKKKYAEDRERQNLEMMKLYQQEKVNPLGGCLPILVQLPVWAGLFTTLRNSFELYGEPFINPMWTDLTYKDPTYILPLALGVTMLVTQMLQPQMMDAAQARIMTWVMPIFFTAIMLNYPAGLTLYIFTNNLLTIAQQYGLRKYLARKAATT